MTQQVRVLKSLNDGTAQVIHVRQSACSGDCHQCSGCGAAKETMVLTANNPIGACAGDAVIIRSETGPVLAAAAVLYLLPMVLFFLGYLVGAMLWMQGPLTGCAAFVLGLVLAIVYDRRVAAKRKNIYTIIGFADSQMPES